MHNRGYHVFPSKIFCRTEPKYFIGEHFGVSEIFLIEIFHPIGGSHHAFVEFFLSHRTETKSFVKEPFCFPENFWYRKIFWIRGGISRFSVEIFMSHSAEKFRKGILLFFRKFGVSKNFMHNRGYNVSCVEKFLSQSADKIRRRTLLCFRRILLPKIFKQRRGEASPFCRKIFSSLRTEKTSPGNHSVKLSGREKFFMEKRGQIRFHNFPSNCFCLTVPKYFIGDHFVVSENFTGNFHP